jgi:hypothetical protein
MTLSLTKALLPQSNPLEFVQAILLGGAVDDCVFEQLALHAVMEHGGLMTVLLRGLLQLPRVALLVVNEAGIVVALVEVLENRREDLGLFVRQGNLLALGVEHLILEDTLEEGRDGKHILVGGEDSLFLANDQGHDGRDGVTAGIQRQPSDTWQAA